MLLQSVCKIKCIVHFEPLKNIKTPVQQDLPTVVGHYVSCMYRLRGIELPTETDSYPGTGVGNFLQILHLLQQL